MGIRFSQPFRTFLASALALALTVAHLWVDQLQRQAVENEPIMQPEDSLYLAPVPAMRFLGLGRDLFVADLLWLRALSYFGTHFAGDKEFRWLDPLIGAIIELDPDFRKIYHWASVVLVYQGPITNESVEASNRILEKALEHFPYDWEFHFMLGCNLYFELRSENPDQVSEWRRRGAAHIMSAASLDGSPPWLPLAAASMNKKSGQNEMAIRHLEEVYLRTEDADLREDIAARLSQLKSKRSYERLTKAHREFEEAWKKDFPYLPPDLFVLVGSKPPTLVPDTWLPRALSEVNNEASEPSTSEPNPTPR